MRTAYVIVHNRNSKSYTVLDIIDIEDNFRVRFKYRNIYRKIFSQHNPDMISYIIYDRDEYGNWGWL